MLNTKKINSERGFTIVELLIVIVVIAVLAAITVVAYNGIRARANASAAQAAANTIMKKAEAANANNSSYPTTTANFANEASLAGSGITLAAISAAPGNPNTVEYLPCAGTGARVGYWDYSAATPAKVQSTIGTCGTPGAALTGIY